MKGLFSYKYCYPLLFSLVLTLRCSVTNGQTETQVKNDSLEFRILQADSCLLDLFDVIVTSDSLEKRFPPKLYYYQILYKNYDSYIDLVIFPMRWNVFLPKNYRGIIMQQEMAFLLYGSLDSLISYTEEKLIRNVGYQNSPFHDSLDSISIFTDWYNSKTAVVGKYLSCNNIPIFLYINNGLNLKSLFAKPID
jgi:hypothetical protein